MAEFNCEFDPGDVLGGLLKMSNSDDVAIKMVDAGLDVMQRSISSGASRHKVTGDMAGSIKKTKVSLNREGSIVGRVKFLGSSGSSRPKSKNGQSFDRTNWIKAFRIEYGTSDQVAKPFVRPAIQGCQAEINSVMQKVFNEEVGDK